jgi:hypothetical protein
MFSILTAGLQAPKAATLHLESGKTYLKSALLRMAAMFGRIGQSFAFGVKVSPKVQIGR